MDVLNGIIETLQALFADFDPIELINAILGFIGIA